MSEIWKRIKDFFGNFLQRKNRKKPFVIKNGVLEAYNGEDPDPVIPDGVLEIAERVFEYNQTLRSISIPDSVRQIGSRAFFQCSMLENVRFPDNFLVIGDSAFYGCNSLREVVFSPGLTAFGARAFVNCRSLREISIPEGTESIPERTFWGCTALTKVSLPASLSTMGKGVFTGLENPFEGMRYHSLVVEESTLPDCLEATCHTDQGELMSLRHKTLAIEGVQFHPESIMTKAGIMLLHNFLRAEYAELLRGSNL